MTAYWDCFLCRLHVVMEGDRRTVTAAYRQHMNEHHPSTTPEAP